MKPLISITIFISTCLHSPLSWGSVSGMGIWCESFNIETYDLGFYFFDDNKVGYFKNEYRQREKYDISYLDLSLYEAKTKKLSWQALEYDNKLKNYEI